MRMDYYQLLDVEPTAPAAEIKAAYYRLAKKYHPDHNSGSPEAEERFKLVSEAYRVLGNEERRLDYDAWLERQKTYRDAPEMAGMVRRRPVNMPDELANMPRRTRVSVRHAYERRADRAQRRREREAREARAASHRSAGQSGSRSATRAGAGRSAKWDYTPRYVPRVFLRRKSSSPSVLHLVIVYSMAMFLILPLLLGRACSRNVKAAPGSANIMAPSIPHGPNGFSGYFADSCAECCDSLAPGLRSDPQQFAGSLRQGAAGLWDSLQDSAARLRDALPPEAPQEALEACNNQ